MAGLLIMRKIFFILFLVLALAATARICTAGGVSAGFADYLFKQGDYYRAIGEYKRYIYEITEKNTKPDNKEQQVIDRVNYKIGLCYLKAGKYDDATSWFKAMEERFAGYKESVLIYNQALALNLAGDYENSETTIGAVTALPDKDKPSDYLKYLTAWDYIYESKWDKASTALAEIKEGIFAGSSAEITGYMKK